MRRLILAGAALASLAAPLAAQPADVRHDRRELHDDRGELRGDRREIRGDLNRGDVREARDDRRDLRGDRRDFRDDRRDFRDDRRDGRDGRHDWRDGDHGRGRDARYWHNYRDDRPDWRAERRYDAGRYYYPRGYSYRAWTVGGFLPRSYWGERYWVGNSYNYGLGYAPRGMRWIRVGPDALLIRSYNGSVVRVVRGIFY